jgi:hypothetical protein
MKSKFVFDPNLTSAVRLAGALDGEVTLTKEREDSTRSMAMIACARWTQSKSATIAEIAEETGVHRGVIQRYSAIGKALLASRDGADPESHEGAKDAHTLMRHAGEKLPGWTLGKVIAEYKAAFDGSGSWAVMAAWLSDFIEEHAPEVVEDSEEESDESEDSTESKEPKGPLSVEDFLLNAASTTIKKCQKEGMKPEDAARLFAEYLFMAAAEASEEEAVVDGAITERVGANVSKAFCAGLVAAAEKAAKPQAEAV